MMWVLRRASRDGGGYVTDLGPGSYTSWLERAKTYPTEEAARKDSCPGNETPAPIDELLRRLT